MIKIILTGGPHAGKTTLLGELKNKHPEYWYVPEPATIVIQNEQNKETEKPGYTGKFPWNNYAEFGKLVIAESLKLEATIPPEKEVVILDRSLVDTIGYARLNNCEFLLNDLISHAEQAHYSLAFFCRPVGLYAVSHVRKETEVQASQTEQFLKKAYEDMQITTIEIPAYGIQERCNHVDLLIQSALQQKK
ncbi:ATP-binding protein [Candidatus Roizmanbacteria bacterium]|nr:ATP-binding protein [Candidatus Roizmanbacteria bacterium]